MARTHDRLDDDLIRWIGQQHVFFVATAPSGDDGHVNLSPKGYDTFRVLDDRTVAYLDLTGSGIETVAHLYQNGRLTIMFCAFEGPPRILRLYGAGEVVERGDPAYDQLGGQFPDLRGARAVIVLRVERISTSCGYAVPFMTYQRERETLVEWTARKDDDGLERYRREKNAVSIDGLPTAGGAPEPDTIVPPPA